MCDRLHHDLTGTCTKNSTSWQLWHEHAIEGVLQSTANFNIDADISLSIKLLTKKLPIQLYFLF